MPERRAPSGRRYSSVPDGPNRRMLAAGMGGLFVISFGAILFVMFQLLVGRGGPSATAVAAPRATPLVVPAGARQIASIDELDRSRGIAGLSFALVLTEQELSQRVQQEVVRQPSLPFRDITAKVFEDRVEFTGTVRASGAELPATVGIKFEAVQGRLVYEITSISFGPVPVPGVARQAIADSIDRQLDSSKLTEQFAIEGLQMRPGSVLLIGRMR